MGRSLKLGTAFGIGIYVHWTFLLLPLLVFYSTWEGDLLASLFAVTLVLLVFGCVVLHELGHALMARRFGIGTRDITILPIGGIARLERMSEKPWEEFWIAVAGPAVNVAIAAVVFLVIRLAGLPFEWLVQPKASGPVDAYRFGASLLVGLVSLNLWLVAFNMVPAFPMDGGRVFRALLSAAVGHERATEAAAAVGMVFAGLICVLGAFNLVQTYNPLTIVLGMFVMFAGQQELMAVRYREAMRRRDAMGPPPLVRLVPPLFPPEPEFSGFTWDRQLGAWIEWRSGRAIAINGQWHISGECGAGTEESRPVC